MPAVRGTFLTRIGQLSAPVDTFGAVTLGDLFMNFRSQLGALTRSGRHFGLVEISSGFGTIDSSLTMS